MTMDPTATPRNPKVFISYAHESEAFREQVKSLADWLEERALFSCWQGKHPTNDPGAGISARQFKRYS